MTCGGATEPNEEEVDVAHVLLAVTGGNDEPAAQVGSSELAFPTLVTTSMSLARVHAT